MSTPELEGRLTSDLEITQQECQALHAEYMNFADTQADKPAVVAEEIKAGECVFTTERHRLIGEMFHLLFSENVSRNISEPTVLTIKVPQDSPTTVDESFEVLKNAAVTTWGTTGYWQGMEEDTQVMEILFYDSDNGNVSQRLLNVAEELGEKFSPETGRFAGDRPGEYVLLASIDEIEGTSITAEDTESSFPSFQTQYNLQDVFPMPGSNDMPFDTGD